MLSPDRYGVRSANLAAASEPVLKLLFHQVGSWIQLGRSLPAMTVGMPGAVRAPGGRARGGRSGRGPPLSGMYFGSAAARPVRVEAPLPLVAAGDEPPQAASSGEAATAAPATPVRLRNDLRLTFG